MMNSFRPFLFVLALTGLSLGTRAEERNFSKNWEFSRDSLATVKVVDLPHDFSMEPAVEAEGVTTMGPFTSASANGRAMGYLGGGTGWYRKTFTVAPEEAGKRFSLLFDGAYMETDVTVNGKPAGSHKNGYTPFYFDITDLLLAPGEANEVIVKVRNIGRNTRWYSGSGLYREVSLVVTEPVHVAQWGVNVTTPSVSKADAEVLVAVSAVNDTRKRTDIQAVVSILDAAGTCVAEGKASLRINAAASAQGKVSLKVERPRLWDTEHPHLYTARVELKDKDGALLDSYEQRFGIRSIACDAQDGLRINGEPVLLRGGCVHHDNGLLGAAAYRTAEFRRVRQLKESGYNAVRCAHNPPSRYFLEACDELGLLVMDEFTDMWEQPKNTDDYSQFFVECWESDLTDMMLRDRNHPSIILWSIGNEIPNWSIKDASRIGKQLSDKVRQLDPTRLVTQGITGAYIHLEWDNSQYTFQHLDVSGYNYLRHLYEGDHAKFPDRVIVGTESYPNQSYAYWKDVEEKPYVIGDFVWTALDHLGEAGLGSSRYVPADQPERQMPQFQTSMGPKENQNPAMMWFGGGGNAPAGAPRMPQVQFPATYVNYCGDIDLVGDVKPQGRYRRVMWDVSPLEILVHEPMPENTKEAMGIWGWQREESLWYFPGHEGEKVQVRVFTKEPQVRLEVNGKVVGIQNTDDNLTATFEGVEYLPGKLVAISLRDGKEMESRVLRTPGKPAAVRILRERYNVADDLVFLKLEVIDNEGVIVPDTFKLNINVQGAEFVASGNGSMSGMESFGSRTPLTHLGGAMVIVRPDGPEAIVDVTAACEGLETGRAIFDGKGRDILKKDIGVGLCSVIGIGADFEDSVRRVAQTGATYVEMNNFMGGRMFGLTPQETRAIMDKYGLRVVSDVTMASAIEDTPEYLARWEETFKEDAVLGVKYVAMTANMFWGNEEHALTCCQVLDKIGAIAKKYGIQFLYHLHNIEFNPLVDSDKQIVDFMIEHTDPDLVKFEDDVFWVQIGGRDAAQFLRDHADRIPMLHVKDFYFIGQGDFMDYKAVLGQFYANGGHDWVLEMEDPMTREAMFQKAEGHNRMSQTREMPRMNFGPGGPGGQRPQPSEEELAARREQQNRSRLKALRDIETNMRTLEGFPFIPYMPLITLSPSTPVSANSHSRP